MIASGENTTTVNEILMAEAHDIGYGQARQRLEDRARIEKITTAGGLELFVGMVADGVGGANAGETASQTAVDSVFEVIQSASSDNVYEILEQAMKKAHRDVREMAASDPNLRTMSTTASIAVVYKCKLYIAHVGDSRVYLVREGKIQQLTMDHSWANEMVRLDRFTPEEVENHPRREELARYIGQPVPFEPDLGVRFPSLLTNGDHPAKLVPVTEGMDLLPGDVVIIATDGLFKERPKVPGHFVKSTEIVKEACRKTGHPQDTANTLVSLALGRRTDDNVSVVVMEVPGGIAPSSTIVKKFSAINHKYLAITLASLLLMILVFFTAGAIFKDSDSADAIPATAIMVTNTAFPSAGFVQIDASVGVLAEIIEPGQTPSSAKSGMEIYPNADMILRTTSGTVKLVISDRSQIYIGPNTTITFAAIAGPGSVDPETILVLQKGELLTVSDKLTIQTDREFQAQVMGGIVGVSYDPIQTIFTVDCLLGNCAMMDRLLNGGGGYGTNKGVPQEQTAEYTFWQNLESSLGGQSIPNPTETPQPTVTETPTETLVPTATKPVINIPIETPTPTPKDKKPGGGGGNNQPAPTGIQG